MLAQQTLSLSSGLADQAELLAVTALGDGLPEDAERCLRAAAGSYLDEDRAERHLFEARRLAPTHIAVLIGLYRFYFYKGRLEDALDIAQQCVTRALLDNLLPLDWREVKRGDGRFGDFDAVSPRFFMFALKGYAYLQMRLGALDEGRAATVKLLELDPSDKIGARVLLSVLDRMGEDDDG